MGEGTLIILAAAAAIATAVDDATLVLKTSAAEKTEGVTVVEACGLYRLAARVAAKTAAALAFAALPAEGGNLGANLEAFGGEVVDEVEGELREDIMGPPLSVVWLGILSSNERRSVTPT